MAGIFISRKDAKHMYDTEQMEQLEKDQKARSRVVAAFAFSIFVFIILIIRGYHPVNPDKVAFITSTGRINIGGESAYFSISVSNPDSIRRLVEAERLMYTETVDNKDI